MPFIRFAFAEKTLNVKRDYLDQCHRATGIKTVPYKTAINSANTTPSWARNGQRNPAIIVYRNGRDSKKILDRV